MKRRLFIALSFVLTTVLSVSQNRIGEVTGVVDDATTGQRLVGANILIKDTFIGTVSDTGGAFRIQNLMPGKYAVLVSMVGYARVTVRDVFVTPGKPAALEVHLVPQDVETQQVVITANRREQSLQDVPVSISTVSSRTIAQRVPTTLDDVLRYVPGVNMMYDQVNIRGSSGYSRGVGTRVLLLFDGLPYLTGDTGEITWETIPVFQISRVEVVKGAGSALYGSSALGGVINVITKDIPEKPEVGFRLYSGAYSNPGYSEWKWSPQTRTNVGGYVSYSDRAGSVRYLLSVARSVDDSYRENDAYHRWDFYTKTMVDLGATQNLTIVGNLLLRSHGNFFWWKSLRDATKPADSQLNGNVQTNRGNLSLSYKEFVSDKLYYTVKGIYYGNFWRDDSAGRVNNVSTSHSFYVESQASYVFDPGHILTTGVAVSYDRVNSNLFGIHPGVGAAVFAQDEYAINAGLKLTAGARFDWQKVSVLNSASQINPKLGLVYRLSDLTSLRGSVGTGFRYPAISELYTSVGTAVSPLSIVPNPNLQAERSASYEIGVSHAISDQLLLDWAVFENDFRDLIEPGVDTTRNPAAIRFENVTKARIRGTEIDLKFNIVGKMLQGEAGYTYIDTKDLSTGEVLKFRPRHSFYGSLQLNFEHLAVVGDYRYMSRVEAIDENLVRFAPIVDGDQRVAIKVADLRVFYDLTAAALPVRVGINVTNVFNYHYVELIGNLAPIRLVSFTIDGLF
ncbi:MAG TPA: TonB-dependent receptor [Bacteroidota bacterium]